MAPSHTQLAALRRLARVYRRILVLAVPAALAACQDGDDALAPESAGTTAEAALAAENLLAAASLDRIAFTTYVAPSGADIWTMSASGTGQTHLTSLTGDEEHPIWSPDHNRIAYARVRNSPIRDIYLINADGTNGHWALPTASGNFITGASWAPDGKSLVAQIWLQTTKTYICKIDLASGQWTHLMPAGSYGLQGRNPIYDKDGSWIYYLSATGYSIRRFQPSGQDVLVKSFTAGVGDLALSPDGSRLAYYKYAASGNSEIYVLNLTTKQSKRLTNDSHQDTHPAWSPDGSQLAFVSNRSGKPQIYTMNSSTGGSLKKITSKTSGADQPSWYR